MSDDIAIQEPTSIAEVESLILRLYDPVSPAVVASIQEVLQRLQKSPQAWILARELLSRPSEKVRFFGALTLMVKLNTDSASLKPEDADELFSSILGWLVESAVDGSSSLVTRKLSSALVIFFLHFPTRGHPCLRRLLCSLYLRRHASTDEIAEFWSVQPAFEPRILETAIVFATDLIDEAGKVDVNSAEQ
ncbi:uncharacterized protein DNG_01356 [Cephalotrichum gorgonifer]|uniref:Uncharacterized protein n=1 Tax=Cephalotrichum gorgonifer TaxID=2041049 RepID=A0AAE8SRR4_9PEZI|nr:uncharacterized protein DNG_01356 [Cephalotrichum gorgonifer]